MNIQIDMAQAANLAVWAVFITDLLKRILPQLTGGWVQIVAFAVACVLSIANIYAAETVPSGHDLTRSLLTAIATAAIAIFGAEVRNRVDRRDPTGNPPTDPSTAAVDTQPATPDSNPNIGETP